MRILFISTTYPHPGNPQRGAFNRLMIEGLSRRNDVRVIAPIPWTESRWKSKGIGPEKTRYPTFYYTPKIFRPYYGRFMWASIGRTVTSLTADWRPDVVIGYWAHPDGEAAVRAAKSFGVPSVVMVGGTDVKISVQDQRRRQCIQHVLNNATSIVTFGNDLTSSVTRLGIEPAKVVCIQRGVDTTVFYPASRDEACAKLGIDPGQRHVLWVGRFVDVKRPERVLRVASALASQSARTRITMIGDGPWRARLQRLAIQNGLDQVVRFKSAVEQVELANWYRAAAVTLLTSDSEGIPNVLRESHACGTPFVATDVGGVRQLVQPGWDELIPLDQLETIPAVIARVLARQEQRDCIETCGPVRSQDEMRLQLEGLLHRICDADSPRDPNRPRGLQKPDVQRQPRFVATRVEEVVS